MSEEQKTIKGQVKATKANKAGWWSLLLSTEEGELWISPGIQATQPCPAQKGQVVEALIKGKFNQVVYGEGNFIVRDRAADEKPLVAQPQQQTGFKPRNNIGTMIGHSTNGAFDLAGYKADLPTLLKAGEYVYNITQEVKAQYGKDNPELTDYDVGASTGMAIRCAANIVRENDKPWEELKTITMKILDEMQSHFRDFINKALEEQDKPKAPVEEGTTTEEKEPESKVEEKKEESPSEDKSPEVVEEKEVEEKSEVVKEAQAPEQTEDASEETPVDDLDDDLPW